MLECKDKVELSPEAQKLEEYKELLKMYLEQYYNCKRKKALLERRLRDVIRELKEPIGGMGYSPVPRSETNKISEGSASIIYRMSEIEERISQQKDNMELAMLKVMDIMDFLPEDSTERAVLELRHIDCKPWKDVVKDMNLTRTPCNDYYNKGLVKLLGFKKVMKLINDYKIKLDKE